MMGASARLWLAVLGVAAALGVSAVPAGAATHPHVATFLSTYNNPCGITIGPEGIPRTLDYPVLSPATASESPSCGLAVDSTGRLFLNRYHGYVEVIESELSIGTIDAGRSTGVATDWATDTLYVAHRDRISVYEAPALPGETPTTIGLGALTDAYGVAVSGFSETTGYVYVADAATATVKVFDPATDPDSPIAEVDGSQTPLGEFRDLTDTALAVNNSNGHLFVLDNLQPGFAEPLARVYEFDAEGNYVGQIAQWVEDAPASPGTEPGPYQRTLIHGGPSGLAVDNSIDPDSGQVRGTIYVSSGVQKHVVFTPEGPVEVGNPFYAFGAGLQPTFLLQIAKPGSGQGAVTTLIEHTPPLVGGAALPGIECGTICATEYDQGTQVTLIATPRPHSTFTGWSVSGQPSACPGTSSFCKVTLTADTEVTANFTAIPQKALTVSKTGNGQGTVTSSPAGIECGPICIAGFDQGSTVTLTAEANVGSEFTGWAGAGCSGTGACKVPMGSEQSVSAEFRAIPRLVPVDRDSGKRTLAIFVSGEGAGTITSDPGGIECGTPCSGAYDPGTKVTLTAKPDEESAFSGWSGCDSSSGVKCTVTLGSSRTVGASFAEATPLEIAGVSLNGAKATLSVAVPGKGVLLAKAKQLKPVSAKARKAETLSLPLALNKAAKKALAKKGKLKVKVTLTFKPTGAGAPRELEKTITFRKKAPAKRAGKK